MSLETLAELRQSLGLHPPDPAQVEIRGADPVLPTRFRVGEAAAAALAACGLEAAAIWELRGGRRQRVRVDVKGAAASLLGYDDEVRAVAERIAGWDGQALEDAIATLGLCGARVLDLTRVLAGPTCGRTLAAHGADVLRIGSPKLPFIAPFVIDTSHGKRSAYLDLDDARDEERLRALARDADVFTQGYRSGALENRGFGPEALHAFRPGIVYTSINCYGHEGPWARRPGWEQLAQAVTGIAYEHGGATSPRLLPAAATDYNTGYLAALGTLIALNRRAREGGSWHVRASLCQTGMWLERMRRCDTAGKGLSPEDVQRFLTRSETAYGPLHHLGPIVELSETPARWALPTPPLGTHPPVWAES